jgi:hypothetical protein
VIKITVEELDILVEANIAGALKEFKKLLPEIKKQLSKVQKEFDKVNIKDITANVNMSKVTKEVKKAKEQIKDAFNPEDISGMTIDGKLFNIKNIKGYSKEVKKLKGDIGTLAKYRSVNTENYTPNKNITSNTTVPKVENVEPSQNSISMWDILKSKIAQVRPYIEQFKMSLESVNSSKQLELVKYKISEIEEKLQNAKDGKIHLNTKEIIQAEAELEKLQQQKAKLEENNGGGFFSKLSKGISSIVEKASKLPSLFKNSKNSINQMSGGLKVGLKNILKYAGALFGLRSIYNVLRNSASSWLSSQNAGAQQLSANIEYMKYAMGSVFAPVIEYIINLVYQLMKAIQQVVYAFSGINIFAKATASSMNKTASSASKASKSLTGVHSEINNVSENDSSGSGSTNPNIDLSQLDNTQNSIIDSIKNGDWSSIGSLIGEKINGALKSIPWDKIKNTAKNIGTGIAQFLNGFIGSTDWNLVGNTIAQGLNTALNFAYGFLSTFDFTQFGNSISTGIISVIENIDWGLLAQNVSLKIQGIFDAITGFIQSWDWKVVGDAIIQFITNIDYSGIADSLFRLLGSAVASLVNLGMVIGDYINQAMDKAKEYFQDKIEECGGNVVLGILKGIGDAVIGIGQWIYEHIFKPFIDGFKDVFGIHSPSTVMAEMGGYIIQGLLNGISSLVGKVKEIWNNMKNTAIDIFINLKTNLINKVTEIKDGIKNKFQEAYTSIKNIFSNIGSFFSGIWNNVKNTFSKLGTSIGDAISSSVKSGINNVITLIQNTINKAIGLINGAIGVINAIPGVNITKISTLNLPRLAKGNVAYSETMAVFGEYSGARNNPEITTPQNIMRETFEDVLSDYSFNNSNNSNGEFKQLIIQFGSTKVALEIEKLLQQARRQNGTATVTI